MEFTWDENKRKQNIDKHNVDFRDVVFFWDNTMLVLEDERYAYGEPRFVAIGTLYQRVMVLVYTLRDDAVRVISFRKANAREVTLYEQRI